MKKVEMVKCHKCGPAVLLADARPVAYYDSTRNNIPNHISYFGQTCYPGFDRECYVEDFGTQGPGQVLTRRYGYRIVRYKTAHDDWGNVYYQEIKEIEEEGNNGKDADNRKE